MKLTRTMVCRPGPIMLQGLPIMLFGNATNFTLLCSKYSPITIMPGNGIKLAEPVEVFHHFGEPLRYAFARLVLLCLVRACA